MSFLATDIRETGVDDGKIIRYYQTYLTDSDHFRDIVQKEIFTEEGKTVSNVSMSTIESIFTPYSTDYNSSGDFPSFERPTSSSLDATSLYLNPFNPLNIFGSGQGSGNTWVNSGHNIIAASVGSGLGNPTGVAPTGELYKQNPENFVFDSDYTARGKVETQKVRAMGLRSPLILSGWGFDVNGNPVPASGDGIHPDTFTDPRVWKTGPVDLRWDDDRKVWTGGTQVKIYLVKMTNEYTPSCFSYEVDRAETRAQYTRDTLSPRQYSSDTGVLPSGYHSFPETGIYDPEYVAYTANPGNSGCFEVLNYTDGEYPYYEAFIIRETNLDPTPHSVYNIWTEDCHDCGHVSNRCGSATNHGSDATKKKILIENPLRQSFNVGDLAFSVKTGRKKQVYTGGFGGGSGVSGSGQFTTDSNGDLSFSITSAGSGYDYGAFAVYNEPCVGLDLSTNSGILTSGSIVGVTTGYLPNQTYNVSIVPKNATSSTEELDIHWVLQAEFKSQQIVTHVDASAGILQTCTMKIQTQGYKSCEHGGSDTSLINNFI
jgi:hypothetical protein